MIEIAELTETNMLKLPTQLARQFQVSDRFAVWMKGDTLVLKRITSPAVTERVAQAPQGEPLSLDEINDIVHQVRREHNAS
jgi:hypothetical protein